MLSFVAITALAAYVAAQVTEDQVATLTMTGDVEADFGSRPGVVIVEDPGQLDVGLPPGFGQLGFTESGWDMKDIRFSYNYRTDELFVGINCYGVCGDADGDGNPNGASDALVARGGVDSPNFANSESALVAFDFGASGGRGPDQGIDVMIGYPSDAPTDPNARFPCTGLDNTCFNVYLWSGSQTDTNGANTRFDYDTSTGVLPHPATDHTPSTSVSQPDLEWSIQDLNGLVRKLGFEAIDQSGAQEWHFNALAFMGSFQDDGVGEDFFPSGSDIVRVDFPCFAIDQCGICGGDGSSCADCAGTPNGNAQYDRCNVCNGNDSTCLDCAGTPNGNAQYDRCDVCNGDDSTCFDCAGTPNGNARYDLCDVCNGNSDTCNDCLGVANGGARYDECNVCAGNNSTCQDCAGVPNGNAVYDMCDVCQGDGSTCRDCQGVMLGTATYDECDVCNGDGSTCAPLVCTSSSSAIEPSTSTTTQSDAGVPLTMNALKRRLGSLKHHRNVLKYKIEHLEPKCKRLAGGSSDDDDSSSDDDDSSSDDDDSGSSDDDDSGSSDDDDSGSSDDDDSGSNDDDDSGSNDDDDSGSSDDDDSGSGSGSSDDDDSGSSSSSGSSDDDDSSSGSGSSSSGDDDDSSSSSSSSFGSDRKIKVVHVHHHKAAAESESTESSASSAGNIVFLKKEKKANKAASKWRKRDVEAKTGYVVDPDSSTSASSYDASSTSTTFYRPSDTQRCAARLAHYKQRKNEIGDLISDVWDRIKVRETHPCIEITSSTDSQSAKEYRSSTSETSSSSSK